MKFAVNLIAEMIRSRPILYPSFVSSNFPLLLAYQSVSRLKYDSLRHLRVLKIAKSKKIYTFLSHFKVFHYNFLYGVRPIPFSGIPSRTKKFQCCFDKFSLFLFFKSWNLLIYNLSGYAM